ncbi:MAG: ABC transporter substrate binding protein [Pseudolabrys sp.]
MPGLIADSIKRNVAVIMAGGPPAAQANKQATSTIPVVFTTGDDPVQAGLVDSINRPAGNLTGVHIFFSELEAKKLGLLLEIAPQATIIAALVNPGYRRADGQAKDLTAAAQKFGQQIEIVRAGSEGEIRTAFATMKGSKIGGLIVAADPFF